MIWAHEITEAYVYEFLLGLTFGGRIVVGFGYVLEYVPPSYHEGICVVILVSESLGTIFIALWYRFADHGWFNLHIVLFVTSFITGAWYVFMVPESPMWSMANEKFDRARESLDYIAAFNRQPARIKRKLKRIKFNLEVAGTEEEKEEIVDPQSTGEWLWQLFIMSV